MEEMDIKKSNLVTTLPYIAEEYKILFDLFVTKHITDTWQSLIHFTTGGNHGKYGDRIPGLWINKNKKLYIMSAVNWNPTHIYNFPKVLEEGKWINVEVSQTLVDNKVGKTLFQS